MAKVCLGCSDVKSEESFSKDSQKPDGLRRYCKECVKKQNKLYRLKNSKPISERTKRDRLLNPEKFRKWSKTYDLNHKEKVKETKKLYRQNNKPALTLYAKNWATNNPEKIRVKNLKSREARKKYKTQNKDKFCFYTSQRRAQLLNAKPNWLTPNDLKQIKNLYKESEGMSKQGQRFHVDHIEPLLGKASCGLHVPWNLQIIPAHDNLSKSNKLYPAGPLPSDG